MNIAIVVYKSLEGLLYSTLENRKFSAEEVISFAKENFKVNLPIEKVKALLGE